MFAIFLKDEFLNFGHFGGGFFLCHSQSFHSICDSSFCQSYADAQKLSRHQQTIVITLQSYNFIKTFAMIESVCITLMIALERWKISTLNRIFRQKWVNSVFCIVYFSFSRQRAFQFGLFGLVSMAISFILRWGLNMMQIRWRSRARFKHQLKPWC